MSIPIITGPSGSPGDSTSSKTINENTTAIHTFTSDENVTWSVNRDYQNGADWLQFSIDSSTGVLTFNSAPNYELPTDNNSDNKYGFRVYATDSSGNSSHQNLDQMTSYLTSHGFENDVALIA